MHEFTLGYLAGKPTDFKMCTECNQPNWYENEECSNFGCTSTTFKDDGVSSYVNEEYRFYSAEGYARHEIDNILIET